jgi:hypothetical protein
MFHIYAHTWTDIEKWEAREGKRACDTEVHVIHITFKQRVEEKLSFPTYFLVWDIGTNLRTKANLYLFVDTYVHVQIICICDAIFFDLLAARSDACAEIYGHTELLLIGASASNSILEVRDAQAECVQHCVDIWTCSQTILGSNRCAHVCS